MESLEDRHLMSAAQIVAENKLAGTTDWQISGNLSANIEGYAAQFSVNHGQTVQFKVDTDADDYRIDIYRMGWYGGDGGRKVATIQPTNLNSQPNALFHLDTNSADASNWHVSASWAVPTNAVSGVYLAKLVREDGTYGENYMIFVVRDDEGHADLLFQTSDTTWEAYNAWGDNSTYGPNYPNERAYAASYSRPFVNYDTLPMNWYFGAEFAMTRFLERNGYDVSYFAGVDTASRGQEILEHKAFLSVGHDEYWSAEQRDNVEAARDAGVNLAFFSGNEVYWKTRWIPDAAGNPFGTMVTYKETFANAKIDPDQDTWTGTWRDPRFSATSDGGQPENALTGTIFTVNQNGVIGTTLDVSGQFAGLRFWRNTVVSTLGPNQSVGLGDLVVGYEYDEDLDNGFRPAGLIPLSYTTRNVLDHILDYGSNFGPGVANHSLTMYRADSDAIVFGAGTIQYAWALDDYHESANAATDKDLQQATINLLADMGAQPGSLMSGMVRATASTDTLAPISTITSPLNGATIAANTSVTVRGTAQERGGGVVAAVEVSVDGGISWHRATGTTSWSYTFTTRNSGPFSILSRAVDDSVNLERNGPKIDINPNAATGTYSLWPNSATPAVVDSKDYDSIELGMRFKADVNGMITGLRFYKSSANTGTHIAHLWTNTGQLLATATFTGETASGWQQVNFSSPVAITAGMTYVASYFAPNGGFSFDNNYFDTLGVNNGPLHAIPQGPSGPNGVFKYGNSGIFPTDSYAGRNYWVDVVFNTTVSNDNTAPTVQSFTAADGTSTLTTDAAIAIKLSEAINVTTVNSSSVQLLNPDLTSIPGGCCSTPGGWCSGCPLAQGANTKVVPATLTYDATSRTIFVTPNAPLDTLQVYTVLVTGGANGIRDLAGNPLATDTGATFLTPAQPASVRSSLWSDTTVPAVADSGDVGGVELGMKFTADKNGTISGLKFYKSAANTGTHVANLWTSTGQLLATATFTNETASGWQQVNFTTPVAITAGTTYVASYHTDSGHFAVNRNYFTSAYDGGMLNVPANGGVFVYGASAFPTTTFQSSNYWVDVVLRTAPDIDNVAPTVAAFTPTAGTTAVPVNSAATVRFSEAVDPASVTTAAVKLFDGGNNLVPATLTYNASTFTATITPTSQLAFGTTYSIIVQSGALGVKDLAGNPIAQTIASSFTTAPAPAPDAIPPTVVTVNPTNGASNVSPTSSFTLAFSEALNAATVDTSSILLLKNATSRVAATVTYNATNRTVTITPTAPLENSASYSIYAIGGSVGIRDLVGNAMVQNFVSSFTTSAALTTSNLWANTVTPAIIDEGAAQAIELGLKFTSDTNGYITGLRFYKSAGNTGTHVAHLWTSTGQLLASATFTSETASGWQQVNFAAPVAITAGTTYVASYFAPNGHFSYNRNYFGSQITSGHIKLPVSAGVYTYGATGTFPTSSYQNSNYWIDPILGIGSVGDTTPPTVTSTSPANGATNIATTSTVTVAFNEAMSAASISASTVKILDGSTIVTAAVTYNSNNNTATITPTVALANSKTYTISVAGGFPGVKDAAGNALAQTFTSTFTTAAAAPVDTTPPTVTSYSPSSGATGVAVSSTVTVTFSEALNASTVTSSTVRLLNGSTVVTATVTYNATNRTATITPSAALSNGQTYTILVTGGSSGIKDLAGNALAQTATSTFTTAVAAPVDTTPPSVTSFSPANGATGVATSGPITATFSEAMTASTINSTTVRLLDGSTTVAAAVTYNATIRTVTIAPTAALSNSKTYTISILGGSSGVKDLAGNALAQTATSSFTTVAATSTSLWNNSVIPATIDEGGSQAVELGMKFTADTNGYITGIRFYKSAGNTGTHVANLWSITGQLLASATFTSETASGWQQVNFATPVAITAGTTYIASYFAPNGHFSYNRNYFRSQITSGHIKLPVGAGVYTYGATSTFPTSSYQNSNYWVDPLFTTGPV